MTGQREAQLVSVAPVLRRAGVQHPLHRIVEHGELHVAEAAIPAGSPIQLDLVLEATGNAVVATGTVSATARCECRRCLEAFDEVVTAKVREIFEPHPVEGETYPLRSEHIDLVPFVRDALLLVLPLAPLCRADCPGPAPDLFPTGQGDGGGVELTADPPTAGPMAPRHDHAAGAEDGASRPKDPRWAALDQLQLDR